MNTGQGKKQKNQHDQNMIEIVRSSDIIKCQQETCEYLQNTKNDDGSFSANICIICEWYIIGTEKIHWLTSRRIFQHRHRLSIDVWEKLYGEKMPSELQKQYEVIDENYDFSGILLSPYAKKNKKGNYMCCSGCMKSMDQRPNLTSPPKYAIANGFAIG